MDKKQEESIPEESLLGSSAADLKMASSIPSGVPDLREGSGSAHLTESTACASSEIRSNMESSVADTAESVQKFRPSNVESSMGDTLESVQKSETSKESIISKPEKSRLSVESTAAASKEVSAPAKSTEKSMSSRYSEVSVTIPTEEEEIEKSEEAEKVEEMDFERERKSERRYMVYKSLQIVLAATMALQVLSIWGYFVFVLFFYVVIADEIYRGDYYGYNYEFT